MKRLEDIFSTSPLSCCPKKKDTWRTELSSNITAVRKYGALIPFVEGKQGTSPLKCLKMNLI